MKKLCYFLCLAAVALVYACKSESPQVEEPQLNFEKPRYTLTNTSVELKLVADVAPTTDISLPVSFSGTAKEGVDFTASQTKFVIKAGSLSDTITLKRVKESIGEEDKNLTVNLGQAPAGFRLGVLNYASVEVFGKNAAIISFDNDRLPLNEALNIGINLKKVNGQYRISEDTEFAIEVDPASTAVQGVHYRFKDDKKSVFVKKNQSSGSLRVEFMKKEAGKDKLVLRLAAREGFVFGSNAAISIDILGPNNFSGTWAFHKIANLQWFALYGIKEADLEKFPKGSPEDKISFAGESYKEYNFSPDLKGDLKNYFGNTPQKVSYKQEADRTYQEEQIGSRVVRRVAELTFPQVNVTFSAASEKKREAVVAFRLITVGGNEVLECTIDDFEPIDEPLKSIAEFSAGTSAPMELAPLRLHFTRVK